MSDAPAARRRRSFNNAPLLELPVEVIDAVFAHPTAAPVVNLIAQLISDLRSCTSNIDFMALQVELFGQVREADRRRAEATGVEKRLRSSGKPPSNEIEPPSSGDPDDPDSWAAEAVTYSRIGRQLRSVGDALAWRMLRYDRQAVLVIGDNPSPGPMVKRADRSAAHDRGLDAEVDALDEFNRTGGQVALLNSLSNCLRIGDITLVQDDGGVTLHEIKSNGRRQGSVQRKRLAEAQAALRRGGRVPRSGMTVVNLAEPMECDLRALVDVVELAQLRGCRGIRLDDGRAVVATAPFKLAELTGSDRQASIEIIQRQRAAALRRAGLDGHTHTFRATTVDQVARMPQLPPWAIYPFAPDACALLICDLALIEIVVSMDSLVELAQTLNVSIKHALQERHDRLDPMQPVMFMRAGDRQLTIYPNSLSPLLFELMTPSAWMRGMCEVLGRLLPGVAPLVRWANDDRHWLPSVP